MTGARLPVAVLGASGYVGQHFVRLLADHPRFEPVLLGAGPRSEGHRLGELWAIPESPCPMPDRQLQRLTPAKISAAKIRIAFSALPSGTAASLENGLLRRQVDVFSNAADLRHDARGTLLIPEINGSRLRPVHKRPLLVTNPNCTATGLALALAPVLPLLRAVAIHMTSYQAMSGAGIPGLGSLAIADNVIPYIAGEEEKVGAETQLLLEAVRDRSGKSVVPILAHCARVPVRDGHLEAVTVRARATPDLESLHSAWRGYDPLAASRCISAPHPPVVLRPEPDRPQPLRDRWAGSPERARGMAVSVGRVRWMPPYLRFFSLSHNAVRGAAGGSVLNAEWADELGWFDRDR